MSREIIVRNPLPHEQAAYAVLSDHLTTMNKRNRAMAASEYAAMTTIASHIQGLFPSFPITESRIEEELPRFDGDFFCERSFLTYLVRTGKSQQALSYLRNKENQQLHVETAKELYALHLDNEADSLLRNVSPEHEGATIQFFLLRRAVAEKNIHEINSLIHSIDATLPQWIIEDATQDISPALKLVRDKALVSRYILQPPRTYEEATEALSTVDIPRERMKLYRFFIKQFGPKRIDYAHAFLYDAMHELGNFVDRDLAVEECIHCIETVGRSRQLSYLVPDLIAGRYTNFEYSFASLLEGATRGSQHRIRLLETLAKIGQETLFLDVLSESTAVYEKRKNTVLRKASIAAALHLPNAASLVREIHSETEQYRTRLDIHLARLLNPPFVKQQMEQEIQAIRQIQRYLSYLGELPNEELEDFWESFYFHLAAQTAAAGAYDITARCIRFMNIYSVAELLEELRHQTFPSQTGS